VGAVQSANGIFSSVAERDALQKMVLLRCGVGAVGAGSVTGGAVGGAPFGVLRLGEGRVPSRSSCIKYQPNASSRNALSLARAVRLENKPNFAVLLKSAQLSLGAAGIPRFALGDCSGLGGPTFGDAFLSYLPAELWSSSSLQDSPSSQRSLQAPLVPFSQR
jgi:hypothetical protein